MKDERDIRLTNAARRAYAEATGRDATTPWEEIEANMKKAIEQSLTEELPDNG